MSSTSPPRSHDKKKEEGIMSNNIFTMSLKSDEDFKNYIENSDDNDNTDLKEEEETKENNEKCLLNNEEAIEVENKTLGQRLFGPIDPGSIRGSIFNLAILSLGSGCLALPQKFGQMSILVSLLNILFAGLAAYWTLNILIMTSEKYKIYNYSKLVRNLFGKGMSLFLDITMLIYIFGVLVLYQVITFKLIGGVVNEFGNFGYKSLDDFFNNSFWSSYKYKFTVMYTLTLFVILPLCLLKNITKMRFNSLFGVISLIFLIMIIIVQTPWYFSDYVNNIYIESDTSTHLNIWDISSGFTSKLYFFKGTATLFYAYSCHYGAFPIYKELKNNLIRRIQKVFARSLLLDGTLYAVVGLAGYLSNPINTPDLIVERYKLFNSDFIMTIGWILFIFTLLMKLPANYNSFRLTLIGLLGYDDQNLSKNLNLMITIPTLIVSTFVGVMYSNITDYISLMGSFCSVIIAFLLPGLLYIKSNDYPITHYKNIISIVIISLLCIIGLTSGIITIRDMIHGK